MSDIDNNPENVKQENEVDMELLRAAQKYWKSFSSHSAIIHNEEPRTVGFLEFWGIHGRALQCYATTQEGITWNNGIKNGYAFGFNAGVYFALNYPELALRQPLNGSA